MLKIIDCQVHWIPFLIKTTLNEVLTKNLNQMIKHYIVLFEDTNPQPTGTQLNRIVGREKVIEPVNYWGLPLATFDGQINDSQLVSTVQRITR